ncbi:MAG: hypothetical protein SWY16_23665 [Cyanobacteriota bacterium]|nr:hypothetical protein [Cyanobacteriota bacterium]
MSEYYLVDVKSITSKVARSEFDVAELETLAQSILEAGGLLSPLLLKQTDIESYEVLAGDREYYGAVRAKEINPRAAEMVNAFVIPAKLEDAATRQFSALHSVSPTTTSEPAPPASTNPASAPPVSANTDRRITNLEARMDEALKDIRQTQRQETQRLEREIATLKQQIPPKVEPLEIFNTADTAELLRKIAKAGIRGKTAQSLVEKIEKARQKTPFTSFTDVVSRIKGLSEKRMVQMLDAWNELF